MGSVQFSTGRIDPTARGYAAVAKLHSDLMKIGEGDVDIDFSLVTWADAHLASALRVIVDHSFQRNQRLRFINIDSRVSTILRKNGFFQEKLPDTYDTTIPWTHFNVDQGVDFAAFARKHLSHHSMPRMTESLSRKFFEGIDEIFANCSLHSQTKVPISVCGQYYPTRKVLAFAISDGGQGVRESYIRWSGEEIKANEAIDWAMQPQSTSRIGDIPGGLGLTLIRDFVAANNGVLAVASDKGFWRQDGASVEKLDMRVPFPGTSIVLEIDSTDRNLYDINENADPDNIW